MKTCACHDHDLGAAGTPKVRQIAKSGVAALEWLMPSMALALVPKCPACIAAYVAMGTGIGISVTTADYLRVSMVFICVAALAILMTRSLRRFASQSSDTRTSLR